jgi:hypothetical protein
VKDGSATPEQSVRIFVEFAEVESAQRAYRDLNGRYFAGRHVAASFFPDVKWSRLDLAP